MNDELKKEIQQMIVYVISNHEHRGVDNSKKIDGLSFKDTPYDSLTAQTAGTLSGTDAVFIANNQTRISEIEAILKKLNILPN